LCGNCQLNQGVAAVDQHEDESHKSDERRQRIKRNAEGRSSSGRWMRAVLRQLAAAGMQQDARNHRMVMTCTSEKKQKAIATSPKATSER